MVFSWRNARQVGWKEGWGPRQFGQEGESEQGSWEDEPQFGQRLVGALQYLMGWPKAWHLKQRRGERTYVRMEQRVNPRRGAVGGNGVEKERRRRGFDISSVLRREGKR